jgi:hypothetical protein
MVPHYWEAYSPDDSRPWDLSRVVHLHRRAAFAGTWDELQRDLKDGPEKAVSRPRHNSDDWDLERREDSC